jgi:predicted DNA-binding ribbon-helix-helix protein
MNSAVIKRSIVIAGHKTSVSLEDACIDTGRSGGNLSSAIRLFVLNHYRTVAKAKPE